MMRSTPISLSSFAGYELPYDELVRFFQRHQKHAPAREQLCGPACILPAWDLSAQEMRELEQLPQVTRHSSCFCIEYDQGTDDQLFDAFFGAHWCGYLADAIDPEESPSFAYVVAPPVIDFLMKRELA